MLNCYRCCSDHGNESKHKADIILLSCEIQPRIRQADNIQGIPSTKLPTSNLAKSK